MKKILIITAITAIALISAIPTTSRVYAFCKLLKDQRMVLDRSLVLDRWLFELKPGEQFIYLDDNSRIRQITFIDAVPNGYAMVCRIHESDFDPHKKTYGTPTRHGYRPTLKQNYFDEMNWTPDTYQIYHGGYYAEEDGAPWIGCYAAGDDPLLLVFSEEGFLKMPIEIRTRD